MAVFLSNLGSLGYGAVSRLLGTEDQHFQSLLIVIGATNMQSGLVKLCFTLCKLMCVSVNHKPSLKALYKRTSLRRANFSTISLKTQRTRKQKAQDKKKYCKWCKSLILFCTLCREEKHTSRLLVAQPLFSVDFSKHVLQGVEVQW